MNGLMRGGVILAASSLAPLVVAFSLVCFDYDKAAESVMKTGVVGIAIGLLLIIWGMAIDALRD